MNGQMNSMKEVNIPRARILKIEINKLHHKRYTNGPLENSTNATIADDKYS